METTNNEQPSFAVDFNAIGSMSFTRPLSYRFSHGREQTVSSWRDLYTSILKALAKKHGDKFSLEPELRIFPSKEIGTLKESKSMHKPVSIKRGIYIETDLRAETILRRIRMLLKACNIPFRQLEILYVVDERQKEAYTARVKKEGPRIYQLNWNVVISYSGTKPISYKYKQNRTKKISSWADLYTALLSDLVLDYPTKIKDGTSSNKKHKPEIVKESSKIHFRRPRNIGNGLMTETMGTPSSLINRMYFFLSFCKADPNQIVIRFLFDDQTREKEYLSKISAGGSSSCLPDIDKALVKQCSSLLRRSFSNGLKCDSKIEYGRFCDLYLSQIQKGIPFSQEDMRGILFSHFPHWGGRVYAQLSKSQLSLLKEVMDVIHETFEGGATCIFLQSILKKYQRQLGESFDIYETDSLGELIVSQSKGIYRVRWNYLCYGRRVPAPDREITEAIKNHYEPISFSKLSSLFWYIPDERIQQIVLTEETIITIKQNQYFYAPNLPIKSSERKHIRNYLREWLSNQTKMTELEFLAVVLQECPSIIEDSSFLTWNGFWKSLLYQFKDILIWEDSYIKTKG